MSTLSLIHILLFGITVAFALACAALCWMILNDSSSLLGEKADVVLADYSGMTQDAVSYTHLDVYKRQVLTYAMFPQVAPKFFEKRNAKKQGVDADHADYTNQSHPV